MAALFAGGGEEYFFAVLERGCQVVDVVARGVDHDAVALAGLQACDRLSERHGRSVMGVCGRELGETAIRYRAFQALLHLAPESWVFDAW